MLLAIPTMMPTAFSQSRDEVPARIGTTYDHERHQPTASDTATTRKSGDVDAQSRVSVQQEVEELLRQTDEINASLEKQQRSASGSPSAPGQPPPRR